MDNSEIIKFLKKFILFSNLDDESLHDISNQIELESFGKESVIVNQGDYGDKIYFIYQGNLDVYLIDHTGNEINITQIGPGDYFGELSLLVDGIRTCSVRAVSNCQLLSLSKAKFNLILDTHLSVSKNLNKLLSKRLGETLNLVAKKKKNIIVMMVCAEESIDRETHFQAYLQKLSNKNILTFRLPSRKNEIHTKLHELNNHIFLLKATLNQIDTCPSQPDYVVNFVDNSIGNFILLAESTPWQIEHAVRTLLKKRVGIALCSGGSLGVAHLTVLRTLQKNNIPLDFIAGTSAGALYGCCYAFGLSMDKIIDYITHIKKEFHLFTLLKNFSFSQSGLMKNNYLKKIINDMFESERQIEDSIIPFAAIASDFIHSKMVAIKSGYVVDGILASNAAPVLFEPVRMNNMLLIDGVATAPLPIQVLYDENIDIKIAVPIQQIDSRILVNSNPKLYTVYMRSRAMMAERLVGASCSLADIIIAPKIDIVDSFSWKHFDEILKAGEETTSDAISKIKYLLDSHPLSGEK